MEELRDLIEITSEEAYGVNTYGIEFSEDEVVEF